MRTVWMRRALLAIVSLSMVSSFGCAFGEFRPDDPFKRQYSLERAQKRYSDLVRWSKFEEAALFVEVDERQDYRARMPDFREVRFTEHESKPWKLDEEMRNVTIEVTYRGYSMRSPIEVEVHETQTWKREGKGNDWTVASEFHDLDRLAGY